MDEPRPGIPGVGPTQPAGISSKTGLGRTPWSLARRFSAGKCVRWPKRGESREARGPILSPKKAPRAQNSRPMRAYLLHDQWVALVRPMCHPATATGAASATQESASPSPSERSAALRPTALATPSARGAAQIAHPERDRLTEHSRAPRPEPPVNHRPPLHAPRPDACRRARSGARATGRARSRAPRWRGRRAAPRGP